MAIYSNNRRLSYIIPASLLAVSLLAGCGEQSAAEYVTSAEGYLQKNDVKAAVIELKNALKQEPKNANARRMLGESYLAMNQGVAAEKELVIALELGSDAASIYPSMIRALNLQSKIQEVIDFPRPKGLKQSDQILTSVLRGVAYLMLGKQDRAKLEFQSATELDKSAAFSQLGQAYFASSEDKIDEAIAQLDALILSKPNFDEAILLKARLVLGKKDYAQASKLFKKLIELNPKNYSYNLQLARILLSQKHFDEAKVALAPVLKRFPNNPQSNLLLAEMEYQIGNYEATRDAATIVLSGLEGNVQAKLLMGLSSYKLNDFEQAHRFLTAVEAVIPPQHPVRRTMALVEYKMGYLDQAADILAPLESQGKDEAQLLEAIGMKQAGKQDFNGALSSLEQALARDPNNNKLKARIGVLKLSQEDSSGLQDLNDAISNDASLGQAKLYEALYYVNQKQFDKALKMARQWQSKVEDRVDGYNLEGLVYYRQEQIEKAKAMFQKAVKLDSSNRTARGHLASIALTAKDFSAAKEQYLALLSAYPTDEGTHIRLAALALNDNNKAEAKGYFEKTLAKDPSADKLRIRYAQLLAKMGEIDQSMAELNKLSAESAASPDALAMKGDLFLSKKQYAEARTVFEAWIKAQPDNVNAYFKLLATYRAEKDLNGFNNALAAAIKAQPDVFEFKRLEIAELIGSNKLELAFQKIDALRANPEFKVFADELDASAYDQSNKTAQALASMEKAFNAEPNEFRVTKLATMYARAQQADKAEALLENWLAKNPESFKAKMALGMLLNNSDPAAAEKIYRELIVVNKNNVVALNNLAWMLADNGNAAEAVILGQRAAELAPKQSSVLDTYAYALMANKQFDKAASTLEQAKLLSPKDSSIKYRLAQSYYQLKRKVDAKKVLEQALVSGDDFPEKSQAEALLKKL